MEPEEELTVRGDGRKAQKFPMDLSSASEVRRVTMKDKLLPMQVGVIITVMQLPAADLGVRIFWK